MRRPSQGWRRLPPRRLHLPRLNGARGATVVLGGALLVSGLIGARFAAPSAGADRAAIALALYGQADPDAVVSAGLHGLGGTPGRVTIAAAGPCRFTLASAGRSETVDLRRLDPIRHATIADPAAGLALSLDHRGGALPQLSMAVLAGRDDAICNEAGCTGRRVFALRDAGALDAARGAAATLRRACPGP